MHYKIFSWNYQLIPMVSTWCYIRCICNQMISIIMTYLNTERWETLFKTVYSPNALVFVEIKLNRRICLGLKILPIRIFAWISKYMYMHVLKFYCFKASCFFIYIRRCGQILRKKGIVVWCSISYNVEFNYNNRIMRSV